MRHDWGPTKKFRPDGEADNGPVLGVTWFAAAQYCRWLSDRRDPKEQMCYPPIPEIKDGMARCPANYLAQDRLPAADRGRVGVRLPGRGTHKPSLRRRHRPARTTSPARPQLPRPGRAGGSLKPNDFGLFDMLGNAWEWCHDALRAVPPGPAEDREQPGAVTAARVGVLRGGGFFSGGPGPALRSIGSGSLRRSPSVRPASAWPGPGANPRRLTPPAARKPRRGLAGPGRACGYSVGATNPMTDANIQLTSEVPPAIVHDSCGRGPSVRPGAGDRFLPAALHRSAADPSAGIPYRRRRP